MRGLSLPSPIYPPVLENLKWKLVSFQLSGPNVACHLPLVCLGPVAVLDK
jgi:hypothetical protein